MNEVIFKQEQWVERPIEEVFDFFKEAKNLEFITPKYLNFTIQNMNTEQVQKESIIDYRLKLHGIPFSWRTRIKDFVENEMFIDEQLKGPYKKWEHTHTFEVKDGGTLIKDSVVYIIPFGALGKWLMGSYIRKEINKIFSYRGKVIERYFMKLQK